MGYIYCITNVINSKKYVGKTTSTIEERFKEHCLDSKKQRCEKRPLYDAMNKYGIENFIIEEIEQISDNNLLAKREIYWINELQTYGRNGYNATKGGDGKCLFDHSEVVELYNSGYTVAQISNKVNCDRTTVSRILKANGIIPVHSSNKRVDQFDQAGNYIQTFLSSNDAAEWLNNHGFSGKLDTMSRTIKSCCNHNRKTAYQYKWEFSKELE